MILIFILFLVAVTIQSGYLLALLYGFSKSKTPLAEQILHPVSVIVCAHDEEKNLRELLPILQRQDHNDLEIIIVDDRSNDNTYDFLLDLTKSDTRIKMARVLTTPERMDPKKYALTLGIKAAKNEILLFTDADCRPVGNEWVTAMTASITNETEFVLGYSPYFKAQGFLNLFIRCESFITALQYLGTALLGKPYMGVGRNLCYRKSLFLKNKGFNDFMNVTGGDDDLFVNRHAHAANTELCITSNALVYSIPKQSWSSFFHQKLRHLMAGKRYKAIDKMRLAVFTLTHTITLTLGMLLLFIPDYWIIVLSSLIIRLVILTITAHRVSKQLNNPLELPAIILLDFLYMIYYLSTGLVALLTKRVKWTN